MALRDGLRSGDVHVPRSRRYADPASFLLTPQQWEPQRLEFCHVVGKPVSAADALALTDDELHAALSDLEAQLARGGGPGEVRLTEDGELVIPPLTAEDVPAEAEALRDELSGLLPRVPIASVLVEVDARTGFTDHLTHAGGKVTRPPDLKRNLLYVIIAEATNMGLGAMAESCGVPYDVLAWTAEWYFRAETLEAANAPIVNYHHRLPMTRAFGTGTLSSSDGQRFPVKGKSLTARHLSRYFARGQGLSTYTHVSDQHSTFDTKVIAATAPESPYVLDGILGNQTDLLITEHATDTHGATLANFALFHLVDLQLSPRIRDLGKITLYRTGPRAEFTARYPSAGHLLTRRLNEELITGMWDDLLRVAASVKGGHATAALVVGKLCSSKRQQNALAAAIKEYGALRRTIYAARYLADETYRRRISRQLNKGENLHALKRSLAYAGEGALRRRHHEQQAEQMWCLTLATNAVVTWTTEYHGLAVTALRRVGRGRVPAVDAGHVVVSPSVGGHRVLGLPAEEPGVEPGSVYGVGLVGVDPARHPGWVVLARAHDGSLQRLSSGISAASRSRRTAPMSSWHRTASLTSGPRSNDDVHEPRRPALKVSARRASGSISVRTSRGSTVARSAGSVRCVRE